MNLKDMASVTKVSYSVSKPIRQIPESIKTKIALRRALKEKKQA